MSKNDGSHGGDLKKRNLAALWATVIITGAANANERFEFYNGIRSLGMGGASAAIVNDETALIANPAALGKLRNYFLTVADPELDIGSETQSVVDNDVMAFLDPQEILADSILNPLKKFHQRFQVFPSFVVTNFGLGFFGKYEVNAELDPGANGTTPDVVDDVYQYDYLNDFAFVLGFTFRFFDGRVKLGANARAVNRVEVHRDDIPTTSTGLRLESMINGETMASEGMGVASDVGLIFTGPWFFLPTLAFVYHDAGTTSYNLNNGFLYSTTQRPDRTPPTLDAAIAIFPIIGKTSRIAFTAELKDVLDRMEPEDEEESDEIMRRVHGGIEFNFSDAFFIRAGMNQGYWTAGLEISMFNSQFQIATYGEEIGDVVPVGSATPYTKVEDRRYVAKFAYRF